MRAKALCAFLATTILLSACGAESESAHEVEAAFVRLVTALRARDARAVFTLSVPEFHKYFEDLQADLHKADTAIRRHFPRWEQRRLRERLLLDRVGGVRDGLSLYLLMTDMRNLQAGAEVQSGLEHDPPTVTGDRAAIRTRAGETFTFVRTPDGWKTDIYLKVVRGLPLIQTLRENLATLEANVRRLQELYGASRDPKSPEGAFNQLVDALGKKDARIIDTLLDSRARTVLQAFAKHLVETVLKGPQAEAARKTLGLADGTTPETPRDIVGLLLAKGDLLHQALGVRPGMHIDHVQMDQEGEAAVVPAGGQPVWFVLGDDRLWHAALDEAVLAAPLFDAVQFTPPAAETP